jgi:hypothetical protein
MKVEERNTNAKYYVNAKLGLAKELTENDFLDFAKDTDVNKLLTDLIDVNAKGFRGVVLTAIVGMQINPKYDPLNDFYACNPRSIFEEGIWYALTENAIPCGKSDPLNVAKNSNQLDEAWATGRKPQKAAMAAVKFLRLVVQSKGKRRELLIDYFFFRLVCYARSLGDYVLAQAESQGSSNRQLAEKLIRFSLAFPEAGHVPQYLIAKLMGQIFSSSGIEVCGGEESVFGTNTTSKKPADIWTELEGKPLNLYEITVKKVNLKRLDDCIDALRSLNILNMPVAFICRIPEDTNDIGLNNGFLTYKGKTFDFVDIREFIISASSLLRTEQLAEVIETLEKFISDINISKKTKEGWNSVFGADT